MKEVTHAPSETLRRVHALLQSVPMRWAIPLAAGFGGGYLLAGAGIGGYWMPLAVALTASLPLSAGCIGAALGGCTGYVGFWGIQTALGPVCMIALVFAAAAIFHNTTATDQRWFMPLLCGVLTALVELVYPPQAAIALRFTLLAGRTALALASPALLSLAWEQKAVGRFFLTGSLICGFAALRPMGMANLGLLAAFALTTLSAGNGAGILWALTCGVAVDAAGITAIPVTAVLCLGSLILKALDSKLNPLRPAAAALCFTGSAVFLLVTPHPLACSAALGSGLGFCLPPRLLPRQVEAESPSRLQKQLLQLSSALGQMQRTIQESQQEELLISTDALYDHAADKVCRCCVMFRTCWDSAASQTCQALCAAAPAIVSRGKAKPEDFPAEFSERCRHLEGFSNAVNQELDVLLSRRQFQIRTNEQRQLLASELDCLSRLLQRFARPAPEQESKPRYRLELGSASAQKNGNRASGDQWGCLRMGKNRCYVLLSDGMGTGEAAERESKTALRLLGGLLRGGCEAQEALQLLNGTYIQREGGAFSAIDILEIDLADGVGHLYKWGGATTYWVRNGLVKQLSAAAPPPGVGTGECCQPERFEVDLRNQAVVVLTTDGVCAPDTADRVGSFTGTNLQDFAAYLIDGAQLSANDDMTALALRLCLLHSRQE